MGSHSSQPSFVLDPSNRHPNSSGPRPVSYATWNQALAAHFFNAAKAGQPVYLQADAEAIQLIGQQIGLSPDEAEPSFIQAVARHIFVTTPQAQNIMISAKYMPSGGEPPGFIAFLAFCVLAASRMERDEDLGVSAANYYRRLNPMLRLDRDGAPRWFADTVIAWQRLEEWLHAVHEGRYGIATAQPLNPVHPYVGYPQSQCLLRASDRSSLPDFFCWARLQPGDMPPHDWLFAMLCDWANLPRCPLSSGARRRILEGGSAVTDALLAIITLELQAWDGTDGDENTAASRRERPLLHLTFHSAVQQVSWYEYANEALVPLSSIPEQFAHVPAGPNDAVAVFGDHVDAGQWTLVPRAALGAMQVVLAHESQGPAIRAFLDRAARPSWREQTFRGIPPGWLCFRGVELLRAIPNVAWDCLRLQDNVAVRLQGGLALERNVYLAGFEPSLVIDGPDPVAPILLDGQPLPDHGGGQTVIPLAPHIQQSGYHTITAGTRTRSFITRSPHRGALPLLTVPQVAYPLRRADGGYFPCATSPIAVATPPATGTIYVAGAAIYGHQEDLPDLLPHTVLVQDGFKGYVILGRRGGEIFEHRRTFAVRKDLRAVRERLLSFDVPFEPQWLIKIGRNKSYLSALQPYVQPPTAVPSGDRDQVAAWVRAVCRKSYIRRLSDEQSSVWQTYATAGDRFKAVR